MVGTVDLRKEQHSTTDDVQGLWALVQQLVGQPFLLLRPTYADELTLHFGAPRESLSPKLGNKVRGTYVLALRGSFWLLFSGPRLSVTFTWPLGEALPKGSRQIDLEELPRVLPITTGAHIV